ncbi:MAG: hypothetical protein IIA67_00165, partial [Planctomycetes bacterium]|nr:hypothetical protein [Planctomycetota bacterium]
KTVSELDETDELTLARPMVLVIGVVATLFSLLVAQIDDIFRIMVRVVNTFGGPLLGVFLLGMLFRRITARAAIAALLAGTLLALWLTFGKTWGLWPWEEKLSDFWPLTFSIAGTLTVGYLLSITARAAITALSTGTALILTITLGDTWGLWSWLEWSWMEKLSDLLTDLWPLTLGIAGTLAVSYLLSFLPATRKSDEELEGLVLGLGHIGQIEPPEATLLIDTSFDDETDDRGK